MSTQNSMNLRDTLNLNTVLIIRFTDYTVGGLGVKPDKRNTTIEETNPEDLNGNKIS